MTAAGGPYRQSASTIRFDWGMPGALAVVEGAAVAVVVDVLSFTTSVSVAIDSGVEVFPYRFRDASAAAFAATRGAVLAVGRREAGTSGVSLSPLSVRAAAADGVLGGGGKLVLPSPNGSAIARQLGEAGVPVVGASLRNVKAVATWVRSAAGRRPVAVVAAGERWPGDLLRPAVEDLWGAGAVIQALLDAGSGPASPEALAAVAAYRDLGRSLVRALSSCASGQELIADGYGDEIAVAAELDRSSRVPVLQGESFRAA
ncbi:2-phosphosulfolactate phosphatase [Nakamurella endophytica]|uniref:Probable 2-phosphosulfolactate phosphatase n=1 Tax=Nakamurella endophytica TaxID=1748367 RepID=A0A917SN92_9ACTN|nr:2-phosphosulfolactate phosphatase [Nakamurella endophytica]GGL88164.1 hypothetical protein GCM10011594_04710 [Nakamurella endophytica]